MKNTILFIILFLLFYSCGKTNHFESPILARVGKSVLTKSDFDRMFLEVSNKINSESEIVSNWIDRELLYLSAVESGIGDGVTIKTQIELYRKALLGRTFLDNYIASDISIDNSEIRDYYDKNRAMFIHKKDGAKIIHFFVNADTVAEFIAKTLRNSNENVDRKELLSNYNVDVLTIERGNLIDVLDNAVFSSPLSNSIVGPLKTDYGYHVIDILSRYSSGSQIDIDEAYDEIYQIIYNQKKQMRSVSFIDSLRNHYNVKIYLENN